MPYLKGTLEEIRATDPGEIAQAFLKGGLTADQKKAEKLARQFLENTDILSGIPPKEKGKQPFVGLLSPLYLGGGKNAIFRVMQGKKDRFLFTQQPLTHTVQRRAYENQDLFKNNLQKILKEGFQGKTRPNVRLTRVRNELSNLAQQRGKNELINGDVYSIEFVSHVEGRKSDARDANAWGNRFLKNASPEQILRVTVWLSKRNQHLRAEKIAFYRKRLKGVPLKFV